MSARTSILHVFSTFDPGGPQVRTAAIMNMLEDRFSHAVLAMDGRTGAARLIRPGVRFRVLENLKKSGAAKLHALWRMLHTANPDVVVTYNWGAIETAALAGFTRICPLVHTEDGFGPDEAERLHTRRVLARRLILSRAFMTVVPSQTLLRIAKEQYRLRDSKLRYIPNGVDTTRFSPGFDHSLRNELGIPADALVFGFVGHLRPEKNLSLLLRAFAAATIPGAWLVIAGEGSERPSLQRLVAELDIGGRVVFAGHVENPEACLRTFDVFTMSSITEQMPVSIVEAMAVALPVVCTDVGDCAGMLARTGPWVLASGDVEAYCAALQCLSSNAGLRKDLGAANRQRCLREFSLDAMVRQYQNIYDAASASRKA